VISTSEHELARRGAAPVTISASSRRLSILTQREIDDLYGLSRFTEEDRQIYFDLSAAEEARVRVRSNRRNALDEAKKLKGGGISEDEMSDLEDQIQKLTDRFVKSIDDHLKHKETEIMKV